MNNLNKKISEMLNRMDEKVMKAKIGEALNMMKNGKQEELARMLDKTDKKELISKLKDIDQNSLKNFGININDLKSKISDEDIRKFKNATDAEGKEIADKLKKLLE